MRSVQIDTSVPYQMRQLDHASRGGMIQDDIKIDYDVRTLGHSGEYGADGQYELRAV